jgi:hypothetical protein
MLGAVQGGDTSVRGSIFKGRSVQGAQHPRIFGRGHIGRGHINPTYSVRVCAEQTFYSKNCHLLSKHGFGIRDPVPFDSRTQHPCVVRSMHCAVHALCGPCLMWSRVGTHHSGAQYPRNALFKGRNIQELSVRDTSVGDTSTLHPVPRIAMVCL